MKLIRHRSSGLVIVLLLVLGILGVVAAGAPVAIADDDDPPDPVPASYYGDVEIDGEPAPVGTTVTAEIDGEERGSIIIEEEGQYGGPTIDDEKLTISGDADDDGADVTFLVDGEPVDTDPDSVTWESASVETVDLSGEDIDVDPVFEVTINDDESVTDINTGETATVVATIENTGTVDTEQDVTFEVDGTVEEEVTVGLDTDEQETLSFETTLDEAGDFDATVRSVDDEASIILTATDDDDDPGAPAPPPADPDPANLVVTDALLESQQITVGETVDVEATVENVGEESGDTTIELLVDGSVVDSDTVELEGAETETVTFTEQFDEPGTFVVSVDDVEAGELDVVDTPDPADLSVTAATVTPEEIAPGEVITVDATVENAGEEDGELDVELAIDDDVVDTQTVSVVGDDTADVSFTESFDDEGTYTISVNDVDAGDVTVATTDDVEDEDEIEEEDDDVIPGFGVIAAFVAILVAALVASRRRSSS